MNHNQVTNFPFLGLGHDFWSWRAQEVPLVAQLLAAGGSAQAAERAWLLRLLAAGLRGPADGPLYRFPP